MKLSEDQTKCVAHVDSESARFKRMAQRCRVIHMPLLASTLESISIQMRNALELQIRSITHPETLLPFETQPEKDVIVK